MLKRLPAVGERFTSVAPTARFVTIADTPKRSRHSDAEEHAPGEQDQFRLAVLDNFRRRDREQVPDDVAHRADPTICHTSGKTESNTVPCDPPIISMAVIAALKATRQSRLSMANRPVSISVTGPCALYSRITMTVDAAAVSIAIAPSRIDTCHGCPTAISAAATIVAVSIASASTILDRIRPIR